MKNKSLEELLVLAAEGDEEAQAEIKERFAAKEREHLSAKRDLRLKTDATLRERYPRALRAWEKGRLKITDDMTEDDLIEALREKEDELAELGVPLSEQTAKATPEEAITAGSAEKAASEDDPAKALAGARASSSPAGQGRDLLAEFEEAVHGPTIHDRQRAWRILTEMQKDPYKEKVKAATKRLEAPPIISRNL